MCGIAGFLDRSGKFEAGRTVLDMLKALDCRGPDSAGVALYGTGETGKLVLRVSLGVSEEMDEVAGKVLKRIQGMGAVLEQSRVEEYLRVVVDFEGDPAALERQVEAAGAGVEVVSMGRRLEIVKQVGSPQNLDETYGVSGFGGSHGIGHTRMSTESRIDLSHSQPFWAHGCPDLAIVHNGHITNYHKLRRKYEQQGVRFYTENDSEIIGIYLGRRLAEGKSLREAMEGSLTDLDGSFSYLAATPDEMGFARDPFAFKPLLFAETPEFVVVATEEIAIRSAFQEPFDVVEAQAKDVRLWQR